MIIGHSDRETANDYLCRTYRMTRQEAEQIVTMSEAMGWAPIDSVSDEAAAAASNDLAFRWGQPYEVRKSVVIAIYRRLLGPKAESHFAIVKDPDEDEPV